MLRPLPFHDADRVVVLNERTPNFPLLTFSAENYRDLCHDAQALEACGAFRNFTLNLSGEAPEPRHREDDERERAADAPRTPVIGHLRRRRRQAGGEPVAWSAPTSGRRGSAASRTCSASGLLLDGKAYSNRRASPAASGCSRGPDVLCRSAPSSAAPPPDRGWHPGIQVVGRLRGRRADRHRAQRSTPARRAPREGVPNTNAKVTMLVTRAKDVMVQGVRTALLYCRVPSACCSSPASTSPGCCSPAA